MNQIYDHYSAFIFPWDLSSLLFFIAISCLIGMYIHIRKLSQQRDQLINKVSSLENDLDVAKRKVMHLSQDVGVGNYPKVPNLFKQEYLTNASPGDLYNKTESESFANTILIIDDDATSRQLVARILENAHWKVIELENGQQAFNYLEHSTQLPTLILLDLMLPDLDGFGILTTLQQNHSWSGIPVIVVTAKDISKEEQRLLYDSTLAILRKGAYTQKELVETILKQVNGRGHSS